MNEPERLLYAREGAGGWQACLLLCGLLLVVAVDAPAQNQPAAADTGGGDALRELVAPVALYPDDLLAIALPASTQPVQIVQAARFLDDYANDSSLQPNPDWDPAVLALINYPDVIVTMNEDLDWTSALGNAVVDDQAAVMDAIQQLRAEAYGAGYLQSSNEQVVVQEQQTIIIQPADPEIIYVPRYDPQVIVVGGYYAPPPIIYSQPYPYYYSPAATFFAGVVVGAAFAYAFDWRRNSIHIDHHVNRNVNRNTNVNIGGGANRPDRPSGGGRLDDRQFKADRRATGNGETLTWNGKKATANQPSTRQRQSTGAAQRPAGVAPARPSTRPGTAQAARQPATPAPRTGDRAAPRRQDSSVGNYQNGRQTMDSSRRGNQSLQSNQHTRPAPQPDTRSRASNTQRSSGAFAGSQNGQRTQSNSQRGNRSVQRSGGGRRR